MQGYQGLPGPTTTYQDLPTGYPAVVYVKERIGRVQSLRFIDRGPQSAGVGKAICQDMIARAAKPLRFIDPRLLIQD